jgi:hypothetical protein
MRKMMKTMSNGNRVLILALIGMAAATALTFNRAAAAPDDNDDEPCARLRGVIVQLKDGRELTGYVEWNPYLFKEGAQFPKSLIDQPSWKCPDEHGQLRLYAEVYPVARVLGIEGKLLVTTQAQMRALRASQIVKVTALPRQHDGYGVYGEIPLLPSPEAVRWLVSEKPQAVINESTVFDGMLISYNREIGRRELEKIEEQIRQQFEKSEGESCSAAEKEWTETKRQLARRRVVALEIFYGCC